MATTLTDPYLKTARAKEHLDSLWEQIAAFRGTRPHRFRVERDLANQCYRMHFRIQPVPDKFALIVGDFLNCLRASLDHLVWALAKLRKPYPRGTAFPILEKPNIRLIQKCTRGVPTEARALIVSLQPYQKEQSAIRSHHLWRLNRLCNIDKHRRIPVHSDVSYTHFPNFPRKFANSIQVTSDESGNAGVVSVPLHLERHMKLDPNASFNIIFGDSAEGIDCDIQALGDMHEFVANNVIPRFSRFFK